MCQRGTAVQTDSARLLGRDLVEDVDEHADLVKLLARVLVEGGHGIGVGEHVDLRPASLLVDYIRIEDARWG